MKKRNQKLKPCPLHPEAPRYYSKTSGWSIGCSECIKERSARYLSQGENRVQHNRKAVERKRKIRHNGDKTPPHLGSCPICQKEKLLVYDHCHETGAFRGWICRSCNTSIGNLGDNLEGLMRAAEYLKASFSVPEEPLADR